MAWSDGDIYKGYYRRLCFDESIERGTALVQELKTRGDADDDVDLMRTALDVAIVTYSLREAVKLLERRGGFA